MQTVRRGKNLAPLKIFFFDRCQVDGRTLTGPRLVDHRSVHLHVADARLFVFRINRNGLAHAHASFDERTCDDGAKSFDRKYPVDGHAQQIRIVVAPSGNRGHIEDRFPQRFDTEPRLRRHIDHRRLL